MFGPVMDVLRRAGALWRRRRTYTPSLAGYVAYNTQLMTLKLVYAFPTALRRHCGAGGVHTRQAWEALRRKSHN